MNESLLEDLNPNQRAAVTTIDGPLIVVAGPGSGKTRVITRRVGWLVECGVAPWEICAVTFTNKAANEMKLRVAELTDGARGFWISTFHSMCARILRRSIEPLGYTGSFTIYDENDRTRAVNQCAKALDLDKDRYRTSSLVWAISDAKSKLLDPEGFAETAWGDFEETCAKVYAAYQRLIKKNNALDFDDLLMKVVELFYKEPSVLDEYRQRFRQLMVDEFQDTNLAQYEIARMLALEHRNICVTGDPDQAIYGWRGANSGNLRSFEQEFPEAQTILLDTNYRSTQAILDAADCLINHNPGRKIQQMKTPNDQGETVALLHADSDRAEARAIVHRIIELMRSDDYRLVEFAIFYRINALSRVFEEVLNQADLVYEVVGAIAFYERREIKDLLCYLSLIVNPRDDLGLTRIANVPRRKIGLVTLQRLSDWAAENNCTLREAVMRAGEIDTLKKGARTAVFVLRKIIREIEQAAGTALSVAELLEQILDISGYRAWLQTSIDPQDVDRLENLSELVKAAQDYDAESKDASPAGFLEEVALYRRVEDGGDPDKIQLMTLHSSKGLEFPVVFIAGCEVDLLPHSRSADSDEQVQEERRLMYVGMTRAEQRLTLSHARWRDRFNQTSQCMRSPFISEIDPELLDDLSSPDRAIDDDDDDDEPPPFEVGQRVRHAYFGIGLVLELDGIGRRSRVRVRFADGTRSLVLEYAGLVAVRR